MHDLSLNLFYKTEFDIQTVDPEGDALWELVMGIRGWICGKWARSHVEIPRDVSRWTQFKKGLSADLDDADRVVHFDSAAFWTSDEMGRWACSITETVQDTSHAPRQWVTEIGFLEESRGKGRVSLVLTYGDRPGFLGSVQPEPSASIPRLVKDLLDNDRLRCTVSGTPAPAQPIELCVGEFPKFWELVSDERRDAPVVLVSPRFPSGEQASLLVDPAHISDALGPSAFVFYTTDQDFCAEMAYELPYDTLRCSNGAVRIYAEHPRMDEPGDSRRHRFFSARSIEEIGSARFVEMLRRALAQFQADKGLVVTGRPDFAKYERALRNFVALDENGALTRIGWTSSGAVVASAGDGSAKPADWGLPAPWAINLQIENPQPANERAPFKQGEQVFLSAVVSRNSYLYCYFTGSDGGTMRLLPNAMSPDAQVSADQAVRMPDWMAPNPAFILDAGKPGTEGVTCLATRDDASTRLPQLVQGPALTTIANVRSADELQRAFGNALGTSEFVAQTIQWKVVPASNGNGNGNGGTARK